MDADPTPDAGTLPSSSQLLAEPLPSAPRRFRAIVEVLACSGYPTQIGAALLMWTLGGSPAGASQNLTLSWLVTLVAIDSVAILALVWFFLRASGERPAATLFGARHPGREAWLGLSMLPLVFAIVGVAALIISRYAPWLTQPDNPFAALVDSPADAAVLAIVGVVGGGVREEVQRAFILHRFEQHLGGARVGLVVFSLLFGLFHSPQGWAAAIMTGLLGAFWGIVYLWRRSIVAPMASHAAFNLIEILVFLRR